MSLIERYFSTSSAGAGDGTTWADRAALFSAGNWSTVITGFNFAGSDALRARIGPGTYTCSQQLSTALFANAPNVTNPLFMGGSDSSGNLLTPPAPTWTADQPTFDDSTLPVIATTTNVQTLSMSSTICFPRLIKFTASGRNGAMLNAALDWCVGINSTANSSAITLAVTQGQARNSVLSCTGSSYQSILRATSNSFFDNVRVVGVTGSSGNRDGVEWAGTSQLTIFTRICSINNGGRGFVYSGSNVGVGVPILQSVFANNGGAGIEFPNTASQTNNQDIARCMITGNGGYGINSGGSNTNIMSSRNRLRDNTSGNYNTWSNYPKRDDYTTDSDDASEYVDSGSGDYRIKNTATIWGSGYGVSEQAASGSGGLLLPRGLTGGFTRSN
jgi:hypothetical protein